MRVITSDYPAVSGDKTPAFDDIWTDIQDTGGSVDFDEALVEMKTRHTIASFAVVLHYEGDGASEIRPNTTSPTEYCFVIGGLTHFGMRKIAVIGDGDTGSPRSVDCGNFMILSFILRAVIEECIFAGVKCGTGGAGTLLEIGNGTLATIRDCKFSGNAGGVLVGNQAYEMLIENCDFLDYLSYTAYHDKATEGAQWIYIHTPPPSVVGANTPSVIIRQCRFDEVSNIGIKIVDYPKVQIDDCRFNISSGGGSNGIYLENVQNAIIRNCHVGYNNVDHAMIKLVNCVNVVIVGLGKDVTGGAPFRVECDSASSAGLKVLNSPGITVEIV